MTLVTSDLGVHRFAGRRQELRTLQRMRDVTSSGGHPVMAVTGEPGIGKSRLLGELIKQARAKGFGALRGQGSELERGLSFGVVTDTVDEPVGALSASELRELGVERLAEPTQVLPPLRAGGIVRQHTR